jgi:hypothetical protein
VRPGWKGARVMIAISNIRILIQRYKVGKSVEELANYFHPAEKELDVLLEQNKRIYFFILESFTVGVFIGILLTLIVFIILRNFS